MKFLLIITLSFFPLLSKSTCIVINVVQNKIYVCADSRRTVYYITSDGSKYYLPETICKIHKVENIYFAISGIDDSTLTINAFKGLRKYKNITEAVNWYSLQIQKHYIELMKIEKKIDNNEYQIRLKNVLGSVSFFGFQNNIPFLISIDFYLKEENNISVVYKITKDSPYALLGIHDHIDKQSNDNFQKNISDKRGLIFGFENFVKLEIANHPKEVNYPIDLLILSNDGNKWIRKKKDCN